MTDITSFLAAEFTEIGLAAAADPHFAERLIEALRCLPTERDAQAAAGDLHPEVVCAWVMRINHAHSSCAWVMRIGHAHGW